jgi:hypothetical protein
MNQLSVLLAIWEKEPKKRNGKEVKFFILKNEPVNVGDFFYGNTKNSTDLPSCYTITEIKEVRESSLKSHNYVTCVCDWDYGYKDAL